ncbi:MAG: MFS transporter [Candidatus Hydrogenedentota bacterium]
MTKQERSWILYDVGNSAYTLIITATVLPIFFKNVAAQGLDSETSTAYWAYTNTAASLCVALVAPVLGAMADLKDFKKRLFMAFFAIGIVSTLALVAVQEGAWLTCAIIYAVSSIGFYGAVVFYDSFLVDVTDDERMDWISASGFAWGYIGSVLPFILVLGIVRMAPQLGIETVTATRIGFVITATWWLLLTVPLLLNVRQKHFLESSGNPVTESFARLFKTLSEIRHYRHVFLFLLAYFCYIDGVHTIIKMATVFGKDIGLTDNTLLMIFLVTQIVAFPSAIIYGMLAKTFTGKNMLLFGLVIYLGVTVFAYFVTSATEFWIMAILVGTAQGGIQALSRSYFAAIVPKTKAAQFFGFYDIFGKFAAVLGPLLVGIFTQVSGRVQSGVLSLIVLFLIGGGLLLLVPQPSRASEAE